MTVPKFMRDKGIKRILGLDFETYFSSNYTLKKLSTTDYVRSEDFYTQGLGVRFDSDSETKWIKPDDVASFLESIDWNSTAVLAHNTYFDGFILSHHYNCHPKYYLDTRAMARGMLPQNVSAALDSVGARLKLGRKVQGTLESIKGRKFLTGVEEYLLGIYCKQDVDLMWEVFNDLLPDFPESELDLIDITVRLYADPVLKGDIEIAKAELTNERLRKSKLFADIAVLLGLPDEASVKKALGSNKTFPLILGEYGVDCPMKYSVKQKKLVPALAKGDLDFQELLDHESDTVREICEARLAAKSSIAETRAERFLRYARGGNIPIMLNMYGAHTQRWSGGDKFNPQNFPRNSKLKEALRAPPGFKVMVIDSSQIEARCLAYLAGQEDLLDAFRDSAQDPYKAMAARIYLKPESEITDVERFVGKVCLAEGSLILSDRGWIPIETLLMTDRLWDGENWVCHQGLLNNGLKKTLKLCNLRLTPDHLVWSGTEWKEARYLAQDELTLYQALATALDSLPLQGTSKELEAGYQALSLSVPVAAQNIQLTHIMLKTSDPLDVTPVPNKQEQKNAIGNMQTRCLTHNIDQDYLIVYPPQLEDVQTSQTNHTLITGDEALQSVLNGEQIEPHFYPTYKVSKDGTIPNLKWIEKITIKDINPATYNLVPGPKTPLTGEILPPCNEKSIVYDVLSVGPKNQFFALTSKGPIIVHNCVLGLGYGMGGDKLQHTLASGAMGLKVIFTKAQAERIKEIYRKRNKKIVAYWAKLENILSRMCDGETTELQGMTFYPDMVMMPNGLGIHYPNLQGTLHPYTNQLGNFTYDSRYARTNIYGGKFTENVVQSYARSVVADQIRIIAKRYRVVLAVHDECVFLVPETDISEASAFARAAFQTPPSWAPGLPLDGELKVADYYAK